MHLFLINQIVSPEFSCVFNQVDKNESELLLQIQTPFSINFFLINFFICKEILEYADQRSA